RWASMQEKRASTQEKSDSCQMGLSASKSQGSWPRLHRMVIQSQVLGTQSIHLASLSRYAAWARMLHQHPETPHSHHRTLAKSCRKESQNLLRARLYPSQEYLHQ